MKKRMKRISVILVLGMIFSLMPQGIWTAFSASDGTTIDVSDLSPGTLPTGVSYASNLFTIGTSANSTTITVTGTTTLNAIAVAAGVTGLTLILNGVSITSTAVSPIDLQGTANITVHLADSTINTLNASGTSHMAGICTNGTATLNLSGATGRLLATGGTNGAGIGGGTNEAGGTITISGGTVTAACGSNYGAGIGGGVNGAGGTITINGGTVTATGGSIGGAGIGGSNGGSGGTITISGGEVTALSKSTNAGIGSGPSSSSNGTIIISGGTVTATGGGGAGIGGGISAVDTINIGASAVVMAVSQGNSPAIYAKSGSSGSAINAMLSSAPSTSAVTYLKCGGNVLSLPSGYRGFAFSATGASPVDVYYDQACTTKLYNIVTNPGGATEIPLSASLNASPTQVNTISVLTGTVTLTINPSNGQVTANATGGNISSAGTLTYTWTGGATGTGQAATPTLGTEATCTVTASSKPGSIQATTTVYRATISDSGNTGTDDVSITDAYGKVGDNVSIAYTLDNSGTLSNVLTYGGAVSSPATISTPGSGTSTYIIASSDAISGTIALTATFAHTNIISALTGTVTLTIDPSNGQVTANATGGNTSSAGTLTYTWTGGATGTGQAATPTPGAEATCTVTASVNSGSIQDTTTVYHVTVTPSGNTGTDDVSITDAYGKVADNVSIAYTLEGSATLNNTLTYSGTASNPSVVSTAVGTPGSGTSTYIIASSDAISGTIALTATFAHTNVTTPDTGDSGKPDHSGAVILINGEAVNLGTSENTVVEGRTITTVTIDEQKLGQMLAAEGDKPIIVIPLKTNADIQICEFNGQMLSNMESKQAVLEIRTDQVIYTLPAQQINLEAVLDQLGTGVVLKDIQVTIEIAKASESVAELVENAAKEGEFTIVAPPLEFNLRCTYGDRTIEVKKFIDYVERSVAIPDGIDPSKITTGILVDSDGIVCHVPTEIMMIDGKYFARISSLTNSIYSVIWNPIEFSDVENHWAKEAVNDMGSRMVISGVGSGMFQPERKTTRAEFAAIIIRSLGLKAGNGNNKFIDVKSTDWYLPYIETAFEYGIISGYDNERFGPMDQITREQAMVMVARAMKITGLHVEFDAKEVEKLLAAFEDAQKSSLWSKESMAECIKAGIVSGKSESTLAPTDQITRAEVAVIVRRLLQKSSLI